MTGSGTETGRWLRPVVAPGEAGGTARGGFERGGWIVQPDRRLSQLVQGRPPGITTHQWNAAMRARLDFVVCDPTTGLPGFAIAFAAPQPDDRLTRMTRAVCQAIGLRLLRIESATLDAESYGRRFVEYVIDAYNYSMTMPDGPAAGDAVSYREIIGRLPDGRQGFVNDLGAVARARAVDAYVNGDLADPLVRGLRVSWVDGPAEGWAWVEVRAGRYLFERIRIWTFDFSFGVAPGQLAEDLAVAGIGRQLQTLAVAEPPLHDGGHLARQLTLLKARRHEMAEAFGYDHVSFD